MSLVLSVIAKPVVILMCAAFLSLFLRRASASTRHAVWILALGGALLLPIVSGLVPQIEFSVLPDIGVVFSPLPGGLGDAVVVDGATTASLPAVGGRLWQSGNPLLVSIWALGVAVLFLRFLGGTVTVRRFVRSSVAVEDAEWLSLAEEVRVQLGIQRPVRLLLSERQQSPITWGLVAHTILLPVSAAAWSAERRRLVLAHELAHVKRNDGLAQMVTHTICSLYWFNPLVWYAAYRVRIERERACDDYVLTLGIAATDYAEHLVQIVRGLRGKPHVSFAALSMAQPSQLETRLVSILDPRARRQTLSRNGAAALSTVAAILIVSLAFVGVTQAVPLPPIVSAVMALEPPVTTAPAKTAERPSPKPARPQRTRMPGTAVIPPKVLESTPPLYTETCDEGAHRRHRDARGVGRYSGSSNNLTRDQKSRSATGSDGPKGRAGMEVCSGYEERRPR
jgi:beta-lactamase regulating signal transducer with metallopeptidase domain